MLVIRKENKIMMTKKNSGFAFALTALLALPGCDADSDGSCFSWTRTHIRAAAPDMMEGDYRVTFSYDGVEYEATCNTAQGLSCPMTRVDGQSLEENPSKEFIALYVTPESDGLSIYPEGDGLSLDIESRGDTFVAQFSEIEIAVFSEETELFRGDVVFEHKIHHSEDSLRPDMCEDSTRSVSTVEIDLSSL